MIEVLEARRLLSLPLSGSVIDLDDNPDVSFITSGNDVLEIILSSGLIQVRNSAGTVLDQISASGITGINVNTQGGNDFVRLGRADGSLMPSVPVTIHGGVGDDTLIGGNSNDQIFGDDGSDRLDGRAGGDRIDGGTGFDTADYGYRVRSINVSLVNSSTANDGTTLGDNSSPGQYNDGGKDNLVDMEAVLGGSNADYMVGNSSANWFDGGGGNDTVFGGDGIDSIIGGANTDLGYGENDADYFFMQDSLGDQFLGGLGTTYAQYDSTLDTPAPSATALSSSLSTLSADSSTTSLKTMGGNGNANGNGGGGGGSTSFVDVVLTADDVQSLNFTYLDKKTQKSIPSYLQFKLKAIKPDGSLELAGTELDDVFEISQVGTTVSVTINSSDRYDFDAAQLTRIVINALGGNDQVIVAPGVTIPLFIGGGDGNDTIMGGDAGDELHGGTGNDVISGGGGTDSLYGEDGDDTVNGDGGDDRIEGALGNDSLSGGDGSDLIYGGAGSETINGGEGNDSLYGEDGNDAMSGDGGDDLIDAGAGNDLVSGGDGNDQLHAGVGDDTITGGAGDDSMFGEDGVDVLLGEAGADSMDGGAGNDSLDGGLGNDEMHGGTGVDSLWGRDGDDRLFGDDGDDVLIGEAGLDVIDGGAGRDVMIGGTGADNLSGGSDDDLLIPGTTSYDNDLDALKWMAAEWTRTDKDYVNRIANLNGGGTGSGNNITYYLRPGSGSSKTVFDDGAIDTLLGGDGMDYFFVSEKAAADQLLDLQSGEKITQL